MAQPRRHTRYWYAFPFITDRGLRATRVEMRRKPVGEWADRLMTPDIHCAAWYRWERRQLRHRRMITGKHTGRARRAR